MKKINTLISVFTLILLAAGCAKETDVIEEGLGQNDDIMTVTLSAPESPDTKTALGAKDGSSYPVFWSASDVITLNGTAATSFTCGDGNTTATASFKLTSLSAPYNFLYCGVAGQGNQVSFPSTQNYVPDGFDPAAMPMYASLASRSDNVTFSHVASLLRFSFTGNKKIGSVTLTAADESMSLSGNFTIGATSGILNGSLTPASGGASLIYSFGTHIQLSDDPFVFYIAIPAGTYEGGITLDIVDNSTGHMTVKVMDSDATKTIAAGRVREFDNVVYSPDKVINLKQIYDVATFQQFVEAVAGGNKTLNARLTQNAATLDISSVAAGFESIEDYKGIFDGNGKTISGLTKPMFADLMGVVKNLSLNSSVNVTSADDLNWGIFAKRVIPSTAIDDIAGLQNCSAYGSIVWTPASAVEADAKLGGLVGNNKGGTFINCTNYASVTFADNGVVNDCQPAIGGVIGRTQKGGDLKTQGDISNCANYGTVVCSADFGQGVYIGGVLGYQVESAESMRGCVNHGLVNVSSDFSTTGPLHIGGVVGIARGQVEECANASDGVVTTEAGSVGTYLCQGGVIGRINNTSETYSSLSNAGVVNVAATGASSGAYIGGTVGRCNEGASISACSNTGGVIEYTGDAAAGEICIGGIVGNTNQSVSSCTNATAVIAGGSYPVDVSGKYYAVGGIVGCQKGDEELDNNTNAAAITFSGTAGGYMALGGVCGYSMGPISGGGNSGTITFSGSSTEENVPLGGIVGRTPKDKSGSRVTGTVNSGSIVINTSTQSGKVFYVGGIVGDHQSGDLNATNSGTVSVSQLSCSQLTLGGLTGQNAGNITAGSANLASGDISVSGLTINNAACIGGITGQNDAVVTASNAGDVVLTSGSTSSYDMFVGGVVGRGKANVTSCTNSGLVSNGCPLTKSGKFIEIGGIMGYGISSSILSNCENTGNVENTANSKGYIYVGGIVGEVENDISSCVNSGAVSNSGQATTAYADGKVYHIEVGGIAGHNADMTFTSCSNSGAVSNSGDSGAGIFIGGLSGHSIAATFETCSNSGDISNSGEANNSGLPVDASVGGLVGYLDGDNILMGTASSFNSNSGAIEETSTNKYVGMGGVTGMVDGAGANLSYVRNLAGGDITYSGNTRTQSYIGGVVGCAKTGFAMDYASNAGDLNFESLTIGYAAWIGGVIGGFHEGMKDTACSFTGLNNSGKISCLNSDSGANMVPDKKTRTYYSYIGGISGVGECSAKEFLNCSNSGAIAIYNQVRTRLGGILGYSEVNPAGCVNTGPVNYCRYNTIGMSASYKSEVGGVVGYMDIATPSGLTNDATVRSTGSSPNTYTGGIVGLVGDTTTGFLNCNVGSSTGTQKSISGAGEGSFGSAAAGLFCSDDNANDWDFTGCKVLSGTKCQNVEVSGENMADAVVGRNHPTSITNAPSIVASF